jgi:hypothetical protein
LTHSFGLRLSVSFEQAVRGYPVARVNGGYGFPVREKPLRHAFSDHLLWAVTRESKKWRVPNGTYQFFQWKTGKYRTDLSP